MSLFAENELSKIGLRIAFKQILITCIVVICFTLGIYFIWDISSAKSALIGGLIGIIPNIIFALKAFRYAGARSARKVVDSFFSGVKIKMVLTAILFSLAFKFLVIQPLPLFGMFCLVMVMPLLQPIINKQ
ncbi:ATP synthase subunit I [Pseudocolwellia sp. AS88]|uniref:ATP synthase subunit I n=1 Tax=Pseudocolwellia sp. AS88 TaxID=3063958 RepID=UPI0026EE6C92|nr:ATP synthase subunit I [Pseudocolwellia sp. AS88]MDO7085136.1 ATP synthase subunit I [Pseudocolwellia sp. AS88]